MVALPALTWEPKNPTVNDAKARRPASLLLGHCTSNRVRVSGILLWNTSSQLNGGAISVALSLASGVDRSSFDEGPGCYYSPCAASAMFRRPCCCWRSSPESPGRKQPAQGQLVTAHLQHGSCSKLPKPTS